MNYITICKVCGEDSTRICDPRYGAEGCRECGAIEQGFLYVQEWEFDDNYTIDEDGNLYTNGLEMEGVIGMEYEIKNIH